MDRLAWMGVIVFWCAISTAFGQQAGTAAHLKVSGENSSFEWFFLIADSGKERRIWARNGLNPEFVTAAGSAAQLKEQVASGIQIGWVNTAEVLIARSQGVPVKIVAAHFGETIAKIFSDPASGINTAWYLYGKSIGVLSPAHTSYKAVLYMNNKLGINAVAIPLGNLESNVAALKEGKIHALYSAEGAALGLVDRGELKIAVRLADVYPRPYTAVVTWATEDLIRARPELVRSFVKGTLEAVSLLQANPDYASDLYIKRTGVSRPVANKAVAELNGVLTSSGRGSGTDLLAAVEGNWRFTKDSGSVPPGTSIAVDDAVDPRFLP